jgi:ribonuclease HI
MHRNKKLSPDVLSELLKPEQLLDLSQLRLAPERSPIVTIVAIDQKCALPRVPIPAAFAIAIQLEPEGEIVWQDTKEVPKDVSDHNEALVLAVLHAVKTLPEWISPELRTTSEYIVKTLKSYLSNWKKNDWRNSEGKSPKYLDSWKQIDSLTQQKNIRFIPEHVKKREAEKSLVFKFLEVLATKTRDEHGQSIGAPLSGFRSEG